MEKHEQPKSMVSPEGEDLEKLDTEELELHFIEARDKFNQAKDDLKQHQSLFQLLEGSTDVKSRNQAHQELRAAHAVHDQAKQEYERLRDYRKSQGKNT